MLKAGFRLSKIVKRCILLVEIEYRRKEKKMILPHYEIIDKLAESQQAAIFKAYHKKAPERLLILKILKTAFLSEYKKTQFRQKIEHLRVLNDPLIITPIEFSAKDETCFITYDYFDGVPLNKLTEAHSEICLNVYFNIACQLARALDKVHEAGIIHGGIKPHNILVNPGTLEIRLIDFISAVDVRDVSHFIYDRSFVRGTLSYTSPEQTGRISHRVVFSSDLYSLGVVFYEMLTSRLPFLSDDPLELIHSHLAEEASRVHELNPDIPPALSKIVAKLMLKEPEKRYQSSKGLLADLLRCRDEYSSTVRYANFLWKVLFTPTGLPSSPRWSAASTKLKSSLKNTSRSPGGHFARCSSPGCPESARPA